MTPAIAHALAAAAAFANAGSALIILYFMQAVTHGAGIRCRLALLQLVQRISYGILAMLLMKNALDIYASGEPPTWQHLGVQFSFLLCCTVSYLRHRLSPPIASWEKPAASLRYGPHAAKPNGAVYHAN